MPQENVGRLALRPEPDRFVSATSSRKEHRWQARSRASTPQTTRPFEGNGKADVLNIGGRNVGKATFEPGWKWSENVKPIAGTDSCQVSHLGYCISGGMTVHMDDGTQLEI